MNFIKRLLGIYFNLLSYILPSQAGKQAFYLFCIPFKAKLNAKQQAFLDTSVKKDVIVDDRKVCTYQWGSGPKKVLLVHGWQSYAYRWKKYIEDLDKSLYTVICFDAPGHGNSEGLYCNVPLYEKTLTEVVASYGKPDTIIAHSIGAFSSMYFLSKNKYKVDKLISMATPTSAGQFIEVFRMELKLNDRAVKYLEKFFISYVGQPASSFSVKAFAPSIYANTLLIHDVDDKTTSHKTSIMLKEHIADSHLLITEGYGHKLKNVEVVKKVIGFIEG